LIKGGETAEYLQNKICNKMGPVLWTVIWCVWLD